jgi:hypothetical protein
VGSSISGDMAGMSEGGNTVSDELTPDVAVEDAAESETPTTEETPEPEGTEEAPPSIDRAAALAALGLDDDALDKVKNLSKWERDINRQSTELGLLRKELADSKPKAADPDDDVPDLDEASMRALRKALKGMGVDPDVVASVTTSYAVSQQEQVAEVTDEFFAAHADVSPEDIVAAVAELGVDVSNPTPRRAKQILTAALKVVQADKAGDTSAQVEARAKALAEEMFAKRVKDDEQVVEVRPRKGAPIEGHKSRDDVLLDDNVSFFDKVDLLTKE